MSYRMLRKNRMDNWDKSCLEVLEATSEPFRIHVDQAFQTLLNDPEMKEYSFPPTLNNYERKFIHEKCVAYNLTSRSRGKEPNRYITVYKRLTKSNFESFFIDLCPKSRQELKKLQQLEKPIEKTTPSPQYLDWREKIFGKLLMSEPTFVYDTNITPHIQRFQQQLPTFERKDGIIETIRNNRVVIVTSETGSGKTTQIPQYILDDAKKHNEKCRIICTQPRRISAVSVAERVSYERGTKLGEAVGYHIRLESKYGSKCNLIYCTNGVLIRTLLSGQQVYKTFTHIIIDEVHERDKLSDFLLICLREILKENRNFKVILMSATIDIQKFENYFNKPAVLRISGRLFPITQLFLSDIIKMLNYKELTHIKRDKQKEQEQYGGNQQFDEIILKCLNTNDQDELEEIWSQILVYLLNENMPVNYQDSKTRSTILMAAIIQENYDMIEKLLHLGAEPRICRTDGCDSLQLARNNEEIQTMLKMNLPSDEEILKRYYRRFNDELINYDIISQLIKFIHEKYKPGGILVFLPGYDDIMICYEYIIDLKMNPQSYRVYFLHSSMSIKDQHEVFQETSFRKIILSTNIAETSVTIDDVVYVIDGGKAKIQTYDSTQWISKACVKQRAGRAGRTRSGICFHVFSRLRYESLSDHRVPEILRVPLEELCLNTKTLDMKFSSIYHFLSLALDPPSSQAVANAIENLQCLGALDQRENLTPLGEYLSQLTIEPHLGKILLYSVIFKCLDPILTIVACMAQKDPFQLPPQINLRSHATTKRKTLMIDTCSDHMTYLNAFIKWQESVIKRNERNFCRDYFICSSTMEIILKTRSQLNKQLRASKFVTNFDAGLVDCNTLSGNWALVKAVLSTGLYPRLAYKKKDDYCTRSEKKVSPHSSSALNNNNQPIWLIYDDMVINKGYYFLRGITPITPITISLMCGVKAISDQSNHLTIDEWLELEFPDSTILHLRHHIDAIIQKKLLCSTNQLTKNDRLLLKILANVLQYEEEAIKMPLPHDIVKQRPLFFELHRGHNNMGYNKIDLSYNLRMGEASNQPSTSTDDLLANASGYTVPNTQEQALFERNTYKKLPSKLQSVSLNGNSDSGWIDQPKSVFLLIHVEKEDDMRLAYRNNSFVLGFQSEPRVREYQKNGYEIYLFFTIYPLKIFCGIARFSNFNIINNRSFATLDWKLKKILYYDSVSYLRNPSNHNVAIFDGNDGQIIDLDVGLILWKIYDQCGAEVKFQ